MMRPLTEDERQKLCQRLRRLDLERDVGIKAADEIERLAENCDGNLAAMRTTQKQYEEMGDRAQKAEREIERLAVEVRKLRDELDLVMRDEGRFIYD